MYTYTCYGLLSVAVHHSPASSLPGLGSSGKSRLKWEGLVDVMRMLSSKHNICPKEGEGQEYRSDLKLLCNDRPKMNIESEQQMQASVISWVVTVSSEWSDRKWEQME